MVFHFFVCSHGYGHIKRDLGIAESLINFDPEVEIWVHVNKDHFEHFRNLMPSWIPHLKIEKLKFEFNSMKLAPDFMDTDNYDLRKYCQWIGTINNLHLKSDHIILSDNLVGVLEVYPGAILLGSFLWTDISKFREYPNLIEILTHEDTLLESIRPKMLGVTNIGMPGTINSTHFIGFPWFCKRPQSVFRNDDNYPLARGIKILFTGGGTNTIRDILSVLIKSLAIEKNISAFLDTGLYTRFSGDRNAIPFDYSEQSYKELDFIIGRPGVGTMTDSVKYCVPLLMIYESDNDEMAHNAAVFQELGLGLDINSYVISDPMDVIGLTDLLKDHKLKNKLRSALMDQPTNGLDLIADYLVNLRN